MLGTFSYHKKLEYLIKLQTVHRKHIMESVNEHPLFLQHNDIMSISHNIPNDNSPFTGSSLTGEKRARVTQKCFQSQCHSFCKGLETVTTLQRCSENYRDPTKSSA
jgi:hypothetical protein